MTTSPKWLLSDANTASAIIISLLDMYCVCVCVGEGGCVSAVERKPVLDKRWYRNLQSSFLAFLYCWNQLQENALTNTQEGSCLLALPSSGQGWAGTGG